MTAPYFKRAILLSVFLFQINSAYADSFRCANHVVKEGDTSAEVKIKCGTPFDIENLGTAKINNKYVTITSYTYLPKKGKLLKVLEFQNGVLVKIRNGPRIN
jgi:hypothetical protein